MTNEYTAQVQIARLLGRQDADGLREALITLLGRRDAATQLRALDAAGLLTRIMPELEPARGADQPHVHFLPVLDHSLEAVAAVEWLLGQIGERETGRPRDQETRRQGVAS